MTNLILPTVFQAPERPTPDDLQAFAAFLRNASDCSEKDFQRLLERHPAIVGVLGYCEFISEHPLYKKDNRNETILDDGRRRDRADLVTAEKAPPSINKLGSYKSANILELKRANLPIAARDAGSRLSDDARDAVEQLKEYRRWITEIPENKQLLNQIGWDVRIPTLTLIMGRDREFGDNPGQLAEMRATLLDQGVRLFTVDDVFRGAQERVNTLDLVLPVTGWSAPQLITAGATLKLMIETRQFQGTDLFRYPPANRPRKHGPYGYADYNSYVPWLRDEFDFRCVYCLRRETWGRLAGDFGVDHFAPISLHPELMLEYDNLVYACGVCNLRRGSKQTPRLPTSDDVRPNPDGTLDALNRDGRIVIDLFGLNREELVRWRSLWIRNAELAFEHDPEVFEQISSWPVDVPNLTSLRPPGNSRPGGLSKCYIAQQKVRLI